MTNEDAKRVVAHLKKGIKYHEDDYWGGEFLTFGYDNDKHQLYIQRIDTIVGSYNKMEYYESEMSFIEILKRYDFQIENLSEGANQQSDGENPPSNIESA